MKTFLDAAHAVQKYLDDEISGPELSVEIYSVKPLPANLGWVFHYNSKAFMKTRNPRDGLAGNAPIIYDRVNGTLHITGTAEPMEYYIEAYLKARPKNK